MKINWPYMCGSVRETSLLFHGFTHLFHCHYCIIWITIVFKVGCEIRQCEFSKLFYLQIILVTLDLFHFNANFIISLSCSTKMPTGICLVCVHVLVNLETKLPLDSKSEWCNRNSESLVVAEECKSKVDLETGRVVCAVTSG